MPRARRARRRPRRAGRARVRCSPRTASRSPTAHSRRRGRAEAAARAEELLALGGLHRAARRSAELLAHGQQRQLAIATALAGRPRVLLLAEPSSGMSAHERAGLGDLLRKIVASATI